MQRNVTYVWYDYFLKAICEDYTCKRSPCELVKFLSFLAGFDTIEEGMYTCSKQVADDDNMIAIVQHSVSKHLVIFIFDDYVFM